MFASMGPVEMTYVHEDHESETGSVVYMTEDISPEGLMAVYDALEWSPTGKVAVKLSTGEPPNSNYLDPELIRELVQRVDGTTLCLPAAGAGAHPARCHHRGHPDPTGLYQRQCLPKRPWQPFWLPPASPPGFPAPLRRTQTPFPISPPVRPMSPQSNMCGSATHGAVPVFCVMQALSPAPQAAHRTPRRRHPA